jgi:histone acetyltransferase (RNA polymerase elongator complex component)
MRFLHPEPAANHPPVHPVFIPFAGCPVRCVFCSQEAQSGTSHTHNNVLASKVLAEIAQLASTGKPPVELAFYGGTFTALPLELMETFLSAANRLKEQALLSAVRCSTRPDALSMELLLKLKALGLETVELGVQSFCAEPLAASQRGYSPETAGQACHMVLEAGLRLGIQLMPGMPGMREKHFLYDLERCAAIRPDFARLYPCLVLEGTVLAELWRKKLFTPWPLEMVLELLPEGLLTLWRKGVKIIRMGLAPQKGLPERILDGPAHPALGQILRSRALFKFIAEKIRDSGSGESAWTLHAPKRFQGEFFGHGRELAENYARIRLNPADVHWWDKNCFELTRIEQINIENVHQA